MTSPNQITNNKVTHLASDLEVKLKQTVASMKKEKGGVHIAPGRDTPEWISFYNVRINDLLTDISRKIRKECGVDDKEEDRRVIARLYHDQYHLDYLAERWARNYHSFEDPFSIMNNLETSNYLIKAMIEHFEGRLETDDDSFSDSEDGESEHSAMSDKEEEHEAIPDDFNSSPLSETNNEAALMKKINKDFTDLELEEAEERVRRGARSRELAYGSADLDLDIIRSRLDKHKGPEWLDQKGKEKMTASWRAIDTQARGIIDAYEARINSRHKSMPGESPIHSEIRHSCTCGQSCWIKQTACMRTSELIIEQLDRAERDAAYRDDRSAAEQARFTCKVKQFVQHLECRLDVGEQIDHELQNFLREILEHAEGTYRSDEEHQAIYHPWTFVLDDSDEKVKLYCRWLRRNPDAKVDSELVESARTVLKRAALMDQEETRP